MKRPILLIFCVLAFAGFAQAQFKAGKVPTVNEAGRLVGLKTCFVISDRVDKREMLVRELNKQFPEVQVIESAADADFFLESRVIDIDSENDATRPVTTSEIVGYIKQNGQRVVVWQEMERDDDTPRSNESNMVRHLVKAIRRAAGQK